MERFIHTFFYLANGCHNEIYSTFMQLLKVIQFTKILKGTLVTFDSEEHHGYLKCVISIGQ